MATQKEGIWIPMPQIDSGGYVIKVEDFDEPFSAEWERKFTYDGFNIDTKNGLWISDIGSFLSFKSEEFTHDEGTYKDEYGTLINITGNSISYLSGDNDTIYSDFKYDTPGGKYKIVH